MKLAFGPKTTALSWKWLGYEVCTAIRDHSIVCFDKWQDIPSSVDVVFAIKTLPPKSIVQKYNVVYIPIDFFNNEEEIRRAKEILSLCKVVAVSEWGLKPLLPFCKRLRFVEHYDKFFLPGFNTYKDKGYALWVGMKANLQVFLDGVRDIKLPIPVKVIADTKRSTFYNKYKQKIEIYTWTKVLQDKMMLDCKAGIDIKGKSFNHMHKPPEKAQQFICSGIPVAIRRPSSSVDYFLKLDLSIPDPSDTYWLSKEYWDEVIKVGNILRPKLTKQAVAADYVKLAYDCFPTFL